MNIEKLSSGIYIARGHAYGRYITATGDSFKQVIEFLFQNIAIYRSQISWG